jgi:HK97 family phage prohead protease
VINPNDQDAMNLYERVKRGDVDQCSFGFNIVSEETEFRDDGSIHWTITEVELHEVSVCTFPAYEDTNVSAREAQREELKGNRLADWKKSARARINKEEQKNA